MSTPNAFPIPTPYLPDYNKNFDNPKVRLEFLQAVQDGLESIRVQAGNNAGSSPPTNLTGTYSGTWTDFATYPPTYSKTGGVVVLEGAVTKSPSATFSPPDGMLTLPVGFRPITTIPFLCLAAGTTGPTTGAVIVTVSSAGAVQFEGGITGSGLTNNVSYISLSGIVFKARA